MKKVFLLLASGLLTCQSVFAQKENNVWVFGDRMGLSFNGATPTFTSTAIRTLGGSASVCNAAGQLLFYTQGDTVWNKNHQIMPNGSGLIAPYASNTGTQSSQGQLILPVIGNPDRYYIFSQEASTDYIYGGDPFASRLYYSVVDMTLNGGLGDVVTGQKKIQLDSGLTSEKMIAIPGENCNLWLLVHKIEDATFKAYEITASGISTSPVVSVSGNMTGPLSYAMGKMKVSPNGKKLALSNWLLGSYGCELFDFNPATGAVSNPVVVDSLPTNISSCFSPDGSKLYLLNYYGDGGGALFQLNLSLSTPSAIAASKTRLDTVIGPGTLVYDARTGPDGKIYVKMPSSYATHDTIGCVTMPNAAGTACAYNRAALVATQSAFLANGDLPNIFVRPIQDTVYTNTVTNLQSNGSLTMQAPAGFHSYLWNTGETTASKTVTTPGTYWVTYSDYCSHHTDTFRVGPPLSVGTIPVQSPVLIYPNPAGNSVTIAVNNPAFARGRIRVLNAIGQCVADRPLTTQPLVINTAHFAAGLYEVVCSSERAGQEPWYSQLVISR